MLTGLRSVVEEVHLDAVNIWPVGDEARQREALASGVLPRLRQR